MLGMFKPAGFSLHWLFMQHALLIQATEVCYWRNQTTMAMINCSDICCTTIPTSPQSVCCANKLRNGLTIPIFLATGVCLFAICLAYFRPFFKHCCCGSVMRCGYRSRVTTENLSAGNTNPIYHINNNDLPDYETICKESPPKDLTPPPYVFVTTHPMDFGIASPMSSAPPQYCSRPNSAVSVRPLATVQS